MKERWGYLDDERRFLYTNVIYRTNEDYFTARLPRQYSVSSQLPPVDSCVLNDLDRMSVWPPLENDLLVCRSPERYDVYIKHPKVSNSDGSCAVAQYLLHEARVSQFFRMHPHPNISHFHGCAVGPDNEVAGLCFQKYAETLAERVDSGRPIDTAGCMAQIKAALDHVHALGLVHNDVVAENIMFRTRGPDLVLIDFDSCTGLHSGLPFKRGPVPEGVWSAERENDYLAMEVIHEMLLEHERSK